MEFNEYFNLGVISKVFSFKGEVTARFDVATPNLYNELKVLFIEHNNNLIPYFIDKIELQNKNFVRLKLKGVDTEEAAKKLIRANIYLPDSLLPKLENDEFYFHDIIGYEIIDNNNQEKIGEVSQVYDLPANPMLETIIKGNKVLIPLNLMDKMDKPNKSIFVTIPDGLLEIY